MVPWSLRSPEVDSPETQSSGRASSWQRGERVSYLAGLAGVVEGVDVLGGEAHHPAVDVIELCAPGGVAGVAAQRCGWCRAPGCHRRQKPGQRAEQRQPRATVHGGRRGPAAAKPRSPGGGGERRAGPPKAPGGHGAVFSAALAMPGKSRRRVPATRRRKADQILIQPPGVSTEGHQVEVVGAQQRGETGGSCRLLSPFPPPFLISENLSLSQPEFQPISSPSTSKRKKQNWKH